jgi:hypothetical protein
LYAGVSTTGQTLQLDLPPDSAGYRTKADWAYLQLRRWIQSGVLEAEQRLDQEELAARLGVSRVPLRQALVAMLICGIAGGSAQSGAGLKPAIILNLVLELLPLGVAALVIGGDLYLLMAACVLLYALYLLRTGLDQHVLVEDAPPQGGIGHLQDVQAGAKDGGHGQQGHSDQHDRLQRGRGHKPEPHGHHQQRADAGEDSGQDQALLLQAQLLLLLFVSLHLIRIAHGVADAAQRVLQFGGGEYGGIVLDEGLFVGQAHVYVVHAIHLAEHLLDGSSAEGAAHAPNLDLKFFR